MTIRRIGDWQINDWDGHSWPTAERDQQPRLDDAVMDIDADGLSVELRDDRPYYGYTARCFIPWDVLDELLRLRAERTGGAITGEGAFKRGEEPDHDCG